MNFAIVGCGHIAKKHAEAIEKIPCATLYAVCDTVTENMDYYVSKYNARPFSNIDELLSHEEIDVINICTPSGTHASITVRAASAKKHVIVEKPIAITLQDADRMIEACIANQVKLAVVHPNRFRPAMQELRNAMNQGLFGKLSHANATVRWNRNQQYYDQASWRGTKLHDGGVLMNQAIHNLDLLIWLMGDVDEVMSMNATRIRQIEAEDMAVGIVRFKSGALGVIEAATTIYPKNLEETLSIFGEFGSVIIGGTTANHIKHWSFEAQDAKTTEEIIKRIQSEPYGKSGHQYIIEDMILAVKEDRAPVVSGNDGRKALALVTALYEAAECHMPIRLTEQDEVTPMER